MSSKAALKGIKASIDNNDFVEAAAKATELVKKDAKNYTALIFQGFAYDKLDQIEQSEKAYLAASQLKPTDPQAFKGLITLYEKHGSKKLNEYHDSVSRLAALYAENEDPNQCQTVIDRYEIFAKKHGTRFQYRHALALVLPTSSLYETLEGRVPHPSHTYTRILESAEAEEKDWINAQIGERRTRLGAKIDQVTQQVNSEAAKKFHVEELCHELISWTNDDEIRRTIEEKTLQRAFDNLLILPSEEKPAQRDRVLTLANGMVIIKHPFQLAWDIALEWVDAESLSEWDFNIFREFISHFPDAGLSKVLRGFLNEGSSPSSSEGTPISESSGPLINPLAEADRLILMVEGIEDSSDSLLAHRIVADTYLSLEEYGSTAEAARKAQRLHLQAIHKFALDLQNSLDAVNITLANSLISYQSPRYHLESKKLFEDILQRKPTATAPLLGVGLVLEEDEDYGEAVKFLQRASERDPSNLRVSLELAWCLALHDDLGTGLQQLERLLSQVESQKSINLLMKAEILYRIGYCKWHLDSSSKARKDKKGAYRCLIDAIKANPSYAPAYTLLGIYFQDYGKSKQRARVALQKAFELSTSELEAASRLAKAFADTAEWDLVELVAKRVVDSGKARPAPGSKKKAFSWPYAALGVVQMNKQQYAQAIVSLQSALRISPEDYHCWVGLGESYHNSGRYVAATRAFTKAESLDHGFSSDQTWFAKYMLANVQREMGSFDEAIQEYEKVLEIVPSEFGVQIALLQTLAESAWAKIDLGMFGEAAKLAQRAIKVAGDVTRTRTEVFNLWKAVGDACAVFAHTKMYAGELDSDLLKELLESGLQPDEASILSDIDKIEIPTVLQHLTSDHSTFEKVDLSISASIVAHKRAIHASAKDSHAQAVGWYNLGWAEHRAYTSASPELAGKGKKSQRFLKAAMRCFKRAIELEAGNSDFWNALGVVTITLSPKVSQHSFVRSLHVNEHSARVWTNLGTLFLVNSDNGPANEAFTRAQSADPEYAHAWLGQGLLATLFGNLNEARGLFLHAFDIANASSKPTQQLFSLSVFDHLIKHPSAYSEVTNLLQPLLALHQFHAQSPSDVVFNHLSALFAERTGIFDASIQSLSSVGHTLETEFESSESPLHLTRFAQAKADLARSQLATDDYQSAISNAQIALDLTSDDDLGPDFAESRHKLHLSAYITVGLAQSYLKQTSESIKMLKAALVESDHAPDLVCMIAQVLWAQGGSEERDAARNQLFDCVERHPDHVGAVTLLAVIGLLDDDADVLEAVEDDLGKMRVSDHLNIVEKMKVARVLGGIVACKVGDGSALAEATRGVMLAPGQPQGWSELAAATGAGFASEMAVLNARKQVPPGGRLEARDLAKVLAGTERRGDALLAIMLCPWMVGGYEALRESLAGMSVTGGEGSDDGEGGGVEL